MGRGAIKHDHRPFFVSSWPGAFSISGAHVVNQGSLAVLDASIESHLCHLDGTTGRRGRAQRCEFRETFENSLEYLMYILNIDSNCDRENERWNACTDAKSLSHAGRLGPAVRGHDHFDCDQRVNRSKWGDQKSGDCMIKAATRVFFELRNREISL